MPFTPFHLGPALLLGLVCYRWLDLPTLLAASVAVDGRATLVFFGYLDYPLHGPLHTFLVSAILGAVIAVVWYRIRPWFDPLLALFRARQERSLRAMATAAIVGVWGHVLLDSFLYLDIRPFAPVTEANPFLWLLFGPWTPTLVYAGCIASGMLGLALYLLSISFPDARVAVDLSRQASGK